ncbi:MAG: hypothetical protein ACJAXS_002464 [Colwellia sp.]|jgi:hypothetical protein
MIILMEGTLGLIDDGTQNVGYYPLVNSKVS